MTSRSAWLALSLTIVGLVAPWLASAADVARGAKLAYTCHGCHGIPNYKNAYPIYSVPKLGGQHTAYLVVALKAYASQERAHATMHSHATTMSEQDMQDIAAYLAGEELKPTGKAVGTTPKAAQTCVACHGNDGIGILPEYPNLAGQHEDYLRDGAQGLPQRPAQERRSWAAWPRNLTDAEIRELAHYYSSQRPGLCATDEIRDEGQCEAP